MSHSYGEASVAPYASSSSSLHHHSVARNGLDTNSERLVDSLRDSLMHYGFHVKKEWLSRCVELLVNSGCSRSIEPLLPRVYSQLLFNPIAIWGEASLPRIRGERGHLAKKSAPSGVGDPLVVEVRDFANIGASQTEQSKANSTEAHSKEVMKPENVSLGAANLRRMLKMIVTDGNETLVAFETTPNRFLNDLRRGCKILVKHASIKDNALMLNSSSCLLGGSLDAETVNHSTLAASTAITANASSSTACSYSNSGMRDPASGTPAVTQQVSSTYTATTTGIVDDIPDSFWENLDIPSESAHNEQQSSDCIPSSTSSGMSSSVDADICIDTSQSSSSRGVQNGFLSPELTENSQSSSEDSPLKDLPRIRLQQLESDPSSVSLLEGVSRLRDGTMSQALIRCKTTGIVNQITFESGNYNFALLVSEVDMSHTEAICVDSDWLRRIIGVDAAYAAKILRPKDRSRRTPNRKLLKSRFRELGQLFSQFSGVISCKLQEERLIQFAGSERQIAIDITALDFQEIKHAI
eukprot:gb/GECG01003638.1/.p1 GENE.gb/GECG01003638.1/~~gb/GECG01003638.1/.p1  ORF type:complete len:524 (+),score=70.96 gb/GECG01003638.1/:1-1572(+)